MSSNENSKSVVFFSTLAGIIFFIWHFYDLYKISSESELMNTSASFQMSTKLFLVPLVAPAILGVFYFLRDGKQIDRSVTVYYWVYAIILVFSTYILSSFGQDSLTKGLPILVVALPVSVIVSLLLVFKMRD